MKGRRLVLAIVIAVVTTACSWGQLGGNAARNSSNPIELGLTTANAGSIKVAWQAGDPGAREPVMSSRYVFSTDGFALLAYALDGPAADGGASRCAGTPATCQEVWKAGFSGVTSNPVVDGDQVFVVSYESGHWKLWAFDANATSCPVTCLPRWTATWGAPAVAQTVEGHSIAVADGRVYVQTDPDPGQTGSSLTVFDEQGVTGCQAGPPRTCSPLFRAVTDLQTFTPPAVVNQRVFVAAASRTLVFDGAGQSGCTAGVCTPLYALATGGAPVSIFGSTAYAVTQHSLMAFDVNGVVNCSDVPLTCQPQWTGAIDGYASGRPTIAAGQVFVSESGGPARLGIEVFDAAGVRSCAGSPTPVCESLWGIASGWVPGSLDSAISATPALLLVSGFTFNIPPTNPNPRLATFDVTGTVNCSGAPKRCTPLSTVAVGTSAGVSSPAVAFGRIAMTNNPGPLLVFAP